MKQVFSIVIGVFFIFLYSCSSQTISIDVGRDSLSLSSDLKCSYQHYQYTHNKPASADKFIFSTEKNSEILEWTFRDVASAQPNYTSDGDTGEVIKWVHSHDSGISFYLTQGTGAHIFSIWPNGISVWSKHNNIFGQQGAVQFVGQCTNIK